jgi:hypothetical protein
MSKVEVNTLNLMELIQLKFSGKRTVIGRRSLLEEE